MSELDSRKGKLLNKFKPLLKNKYFLLLVGVLLFAFIVRVAYLNTGLNQAVWWDAADYLTSAKIVGGKVSAAGHDWTATRPIFLALFWGTLYRFGAGEAILHLTEILFGVLGIFFIYLIGKEFYNKNVGLIAAFIFSAFYLHIFYTIRLMSGIPASTFWFGASYFFWKGFVKEEGKKYKWLTGVFLGLSLFTRAATIFYLPVLFLILLVTKRLTFLKDKQFWIMSLIALLVFTPHLIMISVVHGGNPVTQFLGIGTDRFETASGAPHFDKALFWGVFIFQSLGWAFYLPALIGLYILFEMFLGFDLILKRKEGGKKLLPHLFLFLWFVIPFSYHTIYAGLTAEDRYFLYIWPVVFILAGLGLTALARWSTMLVKSKHFKYVPVIFIILILAIGANAQLKKGDSLIKSRQASYGPVKSAGEWLLENSNKEDIVISNSRYQNIYYSERDTFNYALEGFASPEDIKRSAKEQNISAGTLGYLTEEVFDELVKELKPRYLIVSIFESHPPWALNYADRHPNVRIVHGYFIDESRQQPSLIVYEFTSYDSKKVTIPEPVFALTGDEEEQ